MCDNELPITRNDYAEVGRSLVMKATGKIPTLRGRVNPMTNESPYFNSKNFYDSKEKRM